MAVSLKVLFIRRLSLLTLVSLSTDICLKPLLGEKAENKVVTTSVPLDCHLWFSDFFFFNVFHVGLGRVMGGEFSVHTCGRSPRAPVKKSLSLHFCSGCPILAPQCRVTNFGKWLVVLDGISFWIMGVTPLAPLEEWIRHVYPILDLLESTCLAWSIHFQSRCRIFAVLLLVICTKGLKNCRVVPSVFYSLMERIFLIGRLLELDGTVYIYSLPSCFTKGGKSWLRRVQCVAQAHTAS